MANKHLRQDMKRTFKYDNKRSHAADAPLLSGDQVIAKNNQYTSKTGHWEVRSEGRAGTTIHCPECLTSCQVQLEDVATGQPVCKHESNLLICKFKTWLPHLTCVISALRLWHAFYPLNTMLLFVANSPR